MGGADKFVCVGEGGVWHQALELVCWRRLLASRHYNWVLNLEDPPCHCVGPPFLFVCGRSWHQHIKDPIGIHLQLRAQHYSRRAKSMLLFSVVMAGS